ncbi:MAG: oxidoreductase [Alphaproteobacteria bacterium]
MPRDPRFDILFEPIAIGPVVAKNRFYQVPHCSGMGYLMPETQAAMRGIKAEGGWGVVNTEYCSIHPTSDDTPYPSATIWDDGDVAALAVMADQVHRHGSLAGIELWHGGPRVKNVLSREAPLGVASLPPASHYPVQSRAMDKDDIRAFRRWHVDAARRARQAGFDIVYVYATHGYLLDQFLSPDHNQRSDEYGGSLENRLRLLREILTDMHEAIGADCAVALRFAADDGGLNGVEAGSADRNRQVSSERRDMIAILADLPDLWDITVRDWEMEMSSSRFFNEAPQEDIVSYVKQVTSKPVVGVGRFTSPDTMARMLRAGVLDLIGAARPSIADPFLPNKIAEGRLDEIRECIGCNICYASDTFGAPIRCTQNPTMGEEWRRGWHPETIPPAEGDGKVLVVGAGPAGLEAARALGQRGYRVTLAEARRELGGRVTRESALPGLSEWARVRDYRVQRIHDLANVSVYLDSRLGADDLLEFGFEHVILATGATWRRDGVGRWLSRPLEWAASERVFTPDDIMDGTVPDGPVAIYDDDHYYMASVIARKLRAGGAEVTLITPNSTVASFSSVTNEQRLTQAGLLDAGIGIRTDRAISGFDGDSVEMVCTLTGRPEAIPARSLVVVTAREPDDRLYYEITSDAARLADSAIRSVTRIGDAVAPGTIAAAVHAGHRVAREMRDHGPEAGPVRRERVVPAVNAPEPVPNRVREPDDVA